MRRRAQSWRAIVAAAACTALVAACFGADGTEVETDAIVISGGGTTGIYYGYAGALAEMLTRRTGMPAEVIESGGSVQNLERLAAGEAQLAFSAADAAGDAADGMEPFSEPLAVQAIARVYDDFVHIIVPASSSIETIDDLAGRRVSLGADGSGTELIARRVLDAAGIRVGEVDAVSLGINGSMEALRAGGIDAFFWSGGLPTPGIDELSADFQIRLIDLWGVIDPVRTTYGGGYRHGVVPKGTYGLPDDVTTLAVPNYLMVHADTPDDLVEQMLAALFEDRSEIALAVPAASLLDRARAIFTEPVDLHRGALAYYRESKL